MRVITTDINSNWEIAERLPTRNDFLAPQGGDSLWIPATVPGHVHLDLMRAGIIGDPFYRMQERACQWVDEADWTYRTTIAVTAERLADSGEHGRHFLHFHGLDTLCRVYVNGTLVGAVENFFISHRFDVTDVLVVGNNELRVEFDSALRVGRERATAYLGDGTSSRGSMSYFNFAPRAFVRKAQYMFGWDWGSELISCGIWQNVELVTVPAVEITDWQYQWASLEDGFLRLTVQVDIKRYDTEKEMYLQIRLPSQDDSPQKARDVSGIPRPHIATIRLGAESHQTITQTLVLDRDSVIEWTPSRPSLPREPRSRRRSQVDTIVLRVIERPEDKEPQPALTRVAHSIAYRTIELIQEPDPDGKGASFKFRINGVDTYIKGANWIPDHAFPASITKSQLRTRLQQAKDAGFNMLRVWGGGYYETEDFYDLCDELGILVWQDFPFACSMYPDDLPEYCQQVRQEAIAAVKRLRNHPCLALWCGGNENLELAQGRWAGPTQATEFFGDNIIHNVLPEVLAEHDPKTPYWPNSPYGDAGEGNSQNEDFGDSHYWNVWHSKKPGSSGDWVNYAESRTRFSSEFGFASPAGLTAWESCMADEDKTVRSLVSQWHDKTRKGYETYLRFITSHYPDPQTFDDLVYYGQCNQADALQFGVEHYRRLKGRCWGTLFWQLNDCWPTHSWAVIDSLGEPKAAYFAAKRFYSPLLLSLDLTPHPSLSLGDGAPTEEITVAAHLVNDTLTAVEGTLTVQLLRFSGEALDCATVSATAPSNAASGPLAFLRTDSRTDAFVYATFTDADGTLLAENFRLLAEPKDLHIPNPGLRWQFAPGHDAILFTISATRFAANVYLRFEGLERQPTLSDNYFPLAPGQSRTISITGTGDLPLAGLAGRLRVRHL